MKKHQKDQQKQTAEGGPVGGPAEGGREKEKRKKRKREKEKEKMHKEKERGLKRVTVSDSPRRLQKLFFQKKYCKTS